MYAYFPRLRERRGVGAGYVSGGEQQMVAIGRALMAHPKLMLLDEPSMGLAPMLVQEILDGDRKTISENEDIKEFYLGLSGVGQRRSYRDVKHYRRRKRWLS